MSNEKKIKNDTKNPGTAKEDFFYSHLKLITLLIALILSLLMLIFGDYFNNHSAFKQDVRNIISSVLVGMLFSFFLSIKSIRVFLLKSISHFMTDNSYIDRLNIEEVKKLKGKIANKIHGADIVSNNESLFNYFERLDRFLSIPHKSIVDEKWVYEKISNNEHFFKLTRIQDFRVHTLDFNNFSTFDIVIKSKMIIAEKNLEDDFKNNIKIKIIADQEEYVFDNQHQDLNIEINQENEISLNFIKTIKLEKEYTQIHIEMSQYESIDDSHATYSSHAAYHLNYNVVLPDDYEITNIYHNNTLDLGNNHININQVNKNGFSININGWQLPGLIFVYAFKKK